MKKATCSSQLGFVHALKFVVIRHAVVVWLCYCFKFTLFSLSGWTFEGSHSEGPKFGSLVSIVLGQWCTQHEASIANYGTITQPMKRSSNTMTNHKRWQYLKERIKTHNTQEMLNTTNVEQKFLVYRHASYCKTTAFSKNNIILILH